LFISPAHYDVLSPQTNDLLEVLAEKNTTATFAVVGSRAISFPKMIRRIHENGHQLAISSWSFRPFTTLTNDQIVAEVLYTAYAIHSITGQVPAMVFPPRKLIKIFISLSSFHDLLHLF
jgi:peptidoglycan/xylan/chitin deacetylase (PgdA/CDA1 family)